MWSMTRGTSRSIISTRTRNMSCVFPTKDFSSRVFGSLPIAITYVRVPMSWIGFMTSLRGFTSSPWACRPVVSSTRIFKESESVCLSIPRASSRARSILLLPIWENSNLKFHIKFYLAVNVAVIRLPISSVEGGCNVQAFGFYIISSSFFFLCTINFFWQFFGQSQYQNFYRISKATSWVITVLRKTRLTGKTLFNVPSVWEEDLLLNSYNKTRRVFLNSFQSQQFNKAYLWQSWSTHSLCH